MEALGLHCIGELYDCPEALLNDVAHVEQSLRDAVASGMATLLHEVSHRFHPQGVTALGLISESHVAIHTWPEYGYAAVDAFTCGDRASAEKAVHHLVGALQAKRYLVRTVDRGLHTADQPGVITVGDPQPESGLVSSAS